MKAFIEFIIVWFYLDKFCWSAVLCELYRFAEQSNKDNPKEPGHPELESNMLFIKKISWPHWLILAILSYTLFITLITGNDIIAKLFEKLLLLISNDVFGVKLFMIKKPPLTLLILFISELLSISYPFIY